MQKVAATLLSLCATIAFAQTKPKQDSTKTVVINGVTLKSASNLKIARQKPTRAIVIDTKEVTKQPVALSEIMNRAPGIRIRENGGLGSRPDISINGFTGKAVKYFRDGVPIDYLGDGYHIGNVPMEILDRAEIYRGVLPVDLGADALGGAVNLVNKKPGKKNLNAYYESGSFETYKGGLNFSHRNNAETWLFGGESFINSSENNYKATVMVTDSITKNQHPENLPMFHNAYRNYYGQLYGAVTNRKWADELRISVTGFFWQKEQQHPAMMTDPYGAVLAKQHTVAPSVDYRKIFADGRLEVKQFASYNRLQTSRIDTLRGRYEWYGNFTPKSTPGESRLASDAQINEDQFLARTNINYRASDNFRIGFNYVFNSVKRFGSDSYGQKLNGNGIDLLTIPSHYQKHIFGLGVTNYFLNKNLQNDLVGKIFMYNAEGIDNLWRNITIISAEKTRQKNAYYGVADALKYRINDANLVRISAEYAYRLPEREELFGNSVFVVSNFSLKPEKSLNLNAGYRIDLDDRLMVEANAFYRRTQDLILLVPIQAPNAQYNNVENVRGYGFDLDFNYKINKNYNIGGNATWQDLRLFGYTDPVDLWQNGARLRNTPYFFANANITAGYADVFGPGDFLKLYLHYNFMREFYLETIRKELEPGGFLGLKGYAKINSQLLIPDQHVLNFGSVYQFPGRKYSLGLEVRNLFNEKIFDYYRVQKPGRNYAVKVSYNF